MRRDIDHLPIANREELERVQSILLSEFAEAIRPTTKLHKRNGKVYKIILFGSYARDDWVDEPENGYQSDYDLLIVVSHPDLTDIADYWYVAEDKIHRDPAIARPVNIIVHSLQEVNDALSRGEYFWVDIARDGIALYELSGHELSKPAPLTPADAYEMAKGYFDRWYVSANEFLNWPYLPAKNTLIIRPHSCFIKQSSIITYAFCWSQRYIFLARITSSFSARSPRIRMPG